MADEDKRMLRRRMLMKGMKWLFSNLQTAINLPLLEKKSTSRKLRPERTFLVTFKAHMIIIIDE